MRTHTHLEKITVALAVAAFAVAPAALATPRDGRSPDTRDAALTTQQHPAMPADGRSPDTRDAALAAQPNSSHALLTAPIDRRSPDTIDAALNTQAPVVTVIHSPGFQWSDFGIGAAAAFSAILILGLSIRLLAAHQNRKQTSPVATA
jgi:hypothetical protein